MAFIRVGRLKSIALISAIKILLKDHNKVSISSSLIIGPLLISLASTDNDFLDPPLFKSYSFL